MSNTLLLDRTTWDLAIDAAGNIAMASEPYSLAQDAASAIKLFRGEYWYNQALGIPYFQQILGKNPPINLLKAQFVSAALTVPDIASAKVYFSAIMNGQVSGQIQIKSATGASSIASF